MRLILASASPRRAELLLAAGYQFEVRVADVDERVRPGETPEAYVLRLAREKAEAVHAQLHMSTPGVTDTVSPSAVQPDRANPEQSGVIVLGADTAVVVDHHILGKPSDSGDAERMLRQIAGRSHRVLTGISVRSSGGEQGAVEETVVFVRPMSDQDVAWYVQSEEGKDKAGAYAIQGLASRFIPRIEGSYSNVVGLPVARVAELIALAAVS